MFSGRRIKYWRFYARALNQQRPQRMRDQQNEPLDDLMRNTLSNSVRELPTNQFRQYAYRPTLNVKLSYFGAKVI